MYNWLICPENRYRFELREKIYEEKGNCRNTAVGCAFERMQQTGTH
jgi:hypothetical protein